MLIVFTTTASKQDAAEIAKKAVGQKLAACVQIVPAIESVYEWKGEVKVDTECLLLLKTNEQTFPQLEAFLKDHHPYDIPEIVAVSADKVSDDYSSWLNKVLK